MNLNIFLLVIMLLAALWAAIEQLCAVPEVVAVGETGLDFHYNSSPPADQERVFREHIRLARRLGKPLCIHTRNAEPDTLRIFHEENARVFREEIAHPGLSVIIAVRECLEEAKKKNKSGGAR